MTNNTEGLTPSLRPFLGVGWGRALPASFGFQNGFYSDGVNDVFDKSIINGAKMPKSLTFECWLDQRGIDNTTHKGVLLQLRTAGSPNNVLVIYYSPNAAGSLLFFQHMGNNVSLDGFQQTIKTGGMPDLVNHLLVSCDIRPSGSVTGYTAYISFYLNGVLSYSGSNAWNNTYGGEGIDLDILRPFSTNIFGGADEVRLYNRVIYPYEVTMLYNSGLGNNPIDTEYLMFWYRFEQFEDFDFSDLQDGSNVVKGIRDMSGNGRHIRAANMDTDPLSPGYALKPFGV